MKNKFYGKYKAVVVDINDKQKRGRIRVQCPKVLGDFKSAWCEPCIPVCYEGGGDFYLPKINDTVWIEFEEGDSNKPIWVGNWWSNNNTSSKDYSADKRIIEFDGCKIEMTKDIFKASVKGSFIEIKENAINIIAGSSTLILKDGNIFLN